MDELNHDRLVEEVFHPDGFESHLVAAIQNRQAKREPASGRHRRRVSEFFTTLARAVEQANSDLLKNGCLLRYCIYRRYKRVLIDVVRLDNGGKIRQLWRQDITDDDFDIWVEDLSSAHGVLFDRSG